MIIIFLLKNKIFNYMLNNIFFLFFKKSKENVLCEIIINDD